METKILNREHAELLVEHSIGEDIYISQTAASKLLNITRQRVCQYVKHAEHSKNLGVKVIEDKYLLNLRLVMLFKRRDEFRGKRGKRKVTSVNEHLVAV